MADLLNPATTEPHSLRYRLLQSGRALLSGIRRELALQIPGACLLCQQDSTGPVCDKCRETTVLRRVQRCPRCAVAMSAPAAVCGQCLRHPPAFDQSFTGFCYRAPADQLILALKFGHRTALAGWLGQQLFDAVPADYWQDDAPDCLIPVPLSKQRLQQRGFNQALEIARPLSRLSGVELWPDAIQRLRDTAPQASLPLRERRQNLQHAFGWRTEQGVLPAGRHIALVDDVMTSGMTLHEIATMLKLNGARRVSVLLAARTPSPGDAL